jgi:hypothetical protein
MAARDGLESRRRKLGLEAMSTEEALRVLDYVGLDKPAQIGAGLIQWSKVSSRYNLDERDGRQAAPSSSSQGSQSEPQNDRSLLDQLSQAPDARRPTILLEHVLAIALHVLGFPSGRRIDSQQPLNELGMDSLMAIEFRNMLASEVRQNLPSTLLFNYPTLDDVVLYVGGLLFTVENGKPAVAAPPAASHDPLEFVEDLSDEDVDRLLATKLGALHE